MTETDHPWMVDAKWRGIDLTRAYLTRDRAQVATRLDGLDEERRGFVLALLGYYYYYYHDLLGELGEPPMNVTDLHTVAAVAPVDTEFETTTAVRRIATTEVSFSEAMTDLGLADRIHMLAVCIAVMLTDVLGEAGAVAALDDEAATCERQGYPRPHTGT
ncbi:hypothetical protein [Streptomyces sp. CBMA156]|uniref:hypothetical protein n=1 Tax=Streptomyces sp. CBMA156 TaxID=1930280 RepID=UPI0016620D58|nr:hypothetical protein [Streptomyces sp. CBMA156]MBD0670014.1 hypothetical protein [Streptomyces sp. CBMA156]